MQTFKINKHLEVVCESQGTRYGFRHLATLLRDGREVATAKCCYYNRTWERYEFESVLENLGDKSVGVLSHKELMLFARKIKNQFLKEDPAMKHLKTVSTIMALGNIFGKNQKEKNDWKTRILKAGLQDKGLIMPEDWESLSEPEKEIRLNGAIAQLG